MKPRSEVRRLAAQARRLMARPTGESAAPPGAAEELAALWRALHELHHDGPVLGELAEALSAQVRDPGELAALAFVPDQFNASWSGVGKHAARAAERLAAAALRLDPEHEEALYLYAQEDFLAAVNRGRPRSARIAGPPVAGRPASRWVRKVQKLVFAFEAGEHPLDLFCSMETVPVETDEVVDALMRGLQCREWRGQIACCEALGRAKVGVERVVPALCDRLLHGEETVPGHAAEALAALGKRAPREVAAGALPALVEVAWRPGFDVWAQHEIADALLALAPRAPAALRPAVADCLRELTGRTLALGAKKLEFYGYSDFLAQAQRVLARLSPGSRGGRA